MLSQSYTPYLVGQMLSENAVGFSRSGSNKLTVEDVSMYDAKHFQKLTFEKSAPIFIAYKRTHLKEKSIEMYELYERFLRPHFGKMKLSEIGIPQIREYQEKRRAAAIVPAKDDRIGKLTRPTSYKGSTSQINHELNMLKQMLDRAGMWGRLQKWYKPLKQTEPEPPKTLTREEEDAFFLVASTNDDWRVAYLVASLTNNTSTAGCEIRNLRLCDIDLQANPPRFFVHVGKNEERENRVIPLNATACKQIGRMVERALDLGASEPEHYIFPFRVKKGTYDFTRPASKSWLKKQWSALRETAGFPWLKPHNLRFQCATRMRAAGIPGETIRKQFGWKNLKMLEHYNRPQIDLLFEAVSKVDACAKKPAGAAPKPWMPRNPQKSFGGGLDR